MSTTLASFNNNGASMTKLGTQCLPADTKMTITLMTENNGAPGMTNSPTSTNTAPSLSVPRLQQGHPDRVCVVLRTKKDANPMCVKTKKAKEYLPTDHSPPS